MCRAHQDTVVSETSKIPSMPSIDFYLEKEIAKATTMLYNFKNTLGEEKIPRELLDIARGVVFFTIIKVGFMFTGRYGTGLVVAKLPDGSWSAPSAVQMSGLGWGLQVGAELTDVMLILSSESAVNAFKSRAQVSVGAELGVSVGPVGRSIESDVTAGNKGAAHAFSYAQSKGLFVGASLEASGIAARPDVNRTFYGEKVSISALLQGDYPRPRGAQVLYDALNEVLYSSRAPTPSPTSRGMNSLVESPTPADQDRVDSNNSSTSSTGSAKLSSQPPAPGHAQTQGQGQSSNGLPPPVPLPGSRGQAQASPASAKGAPPRKSASAQGSNVYAASVDAAPAPSAPAAEGDAVDVLL
jgi:lipid-binding SYLF domain-containing protein